MRATILTLLMACMLLLDACINGHYRKGVRSYDRAAYHQAIGHFERYLQKGQCPDAMIKLANSYRFENDVPNTAKWYAKVVTLPESQPMDLFYYARSLMSMGDYSDAVIWFERYLEKAPHDLSAAMLESSCRATTDFMVDTTLYTVKEADIPLVASAFSQTPYKGGIIFTADRNTSPSRTYGWTGRSYLDLYFARKDQGGKWSDPVMLGGDVSGRYQEGPACFNKAGDVMYFTRSNYKGRRLGEDAQHENNLKICTAELKDGKWENIQELPFNSSDYSCGHASLAPDGKTLYFVSDMPGGYGGTDIYKTTHDGSTWSKPQNLGPVVNTEGNEMFPYMHADGTLYFSSTSHNNLGGLDVFMTSFDGTNWKPVENLNYPLNSKADDFAFVLNDDNRTGYVSSNRGNLVDDKIYEVTKNDPTFILFGTAIQKDLGLGLDSAVVELQNMTDNTSQRLYTDAKGNYLVQLKANSFYRVNCSKEMFFTVSQTRFLDLRGLKVSDKFVANFELEKLVVQKPIVLQNIYYDLDKWFIREDAKPELDRVVKLMKENPAIYIELSSHTDARAGDAYNMNLSNKRAKAAVDYLIQKGVEQERLSWKGYGETHLVNRCSNGVTCSEEEHQQNRRTEFKLIKVKRIKT